MRKTVSNLLVVGTQLLIVGLFFTTILSNDMKEVKHVSTIHNNNLIMIATSVSLLFEEENLNNSIEEIDKKLEEMVIEELPSVDVVYEDSKKNADETPKEDDSNKSTPLVSIDADKYINKTNVGFNVTENNKNYTIDGYEFDVVVAVVAAEYHENYRDDALAVVSVILNRCDSDKWIKWAGASPYDQVVMNGQFEVYFTSNSSISYKRFMPGGSLYNSSKYEIAKQAVLDGLNGIRNNSYLGFRSHSTFYINKNTGEDYNANFIVPGGNKFGYN